MTNLECIIFGLVYFAGMVGGTYLWFVHPFLLPSVIFIGGLLVSICQVFSNKE